MLVNEVVDAFKLEVLQLDNLQSCNYLNAGKLVARSTILGLSPARLLRPSPTRTSRCFAAGFLTTAHPAASCCSIIVIRADRC